MKLVTAVICLVGVALPASNDFANGIANVIFGSLLFLIGYYWKESE